MTSQTTELFGVTRTSWLGRYGRPSQIRRRAAYTLASTVRIGDGSPCVVLVSGPGADQTRAAEMFARIERAHNALHDECIPPVSARGMFQGRPFLELACDAVMDGVQLHRRLIDARLRVPVGAADAFATELGRALDVAHAARVPLVRRPICLGRLSYANLLFAPSGRFYLVGFGHNFVVETPSGLPDGWVMTFQAPEVAIGEAPSPSGDHVALHLLLRSLLPLLDLGPTLARILFGEPEPPDMEILHCARWPDVHLVAEPPTRRRTRAEAAAMADRLRTLCQISPDLQGFTRLVRQILKDAVAPRSSPAGRRTLVIGVETSWIVGTDGSRQVLGQAHRRIVTALADLHRTAPGEILTMREILEIGWPGESPIAEAGANRVYVALTQLRRMGLRDLLERCDGGYRFVPDVQIELSS